MSSGWQLSDPSADEHRVCIFGIVRSIAVGVVSDTDLTCKLIKDSNRECILAEYRRERCTRFYLV